MTTDTLPPLSAPSAPLATPNAPRRCFICLNDQLPSDPPDSWVDPCPCTLEAHQDCMQSWVTDCERSNKPLRCPVCKSEIQLILPFDPILSLSEVISRNFSRASPFLLLTGSSMGMGMALEAYGIGALWAVAGREATWKFILGNNMLFDATKVGGVQKRSLVLMSAAPILLTNRLLPTLSMKLALPCVSFFTMYHAMHDPGFFAWPPSPQLALALLPYFRSVYFNIWRETILPYEVQLNRTLLGLPPLEETNNANNGGNNNAPNNRDNQRNMDGGLMGMLQGLLDVLDPDPDDDFEGEGGAELRFVQQEVNAGEAGGIELQLVIEEVEEQDEGAAVIGENQEPDVGRAGDQENVAEEQRDDNAPQGMEDFVPIPQPPVGDDAPNDDDFAAPPPDIGLNPAGPEDHEAPQAPPARRPSLGTVLLNISNALVGTLALPLMSFAAGELLRLALPRSWTSMPVGLHRTRGLMQQQWGRSLVGGSMYVVMRDVLRVYAKHRKVAAMGMRRVKNVERKRK